MPEVDPPSFHFSGRSGYGEIISGKTTTMRQIAQALNMDRSLQILRKSKEKYREKVKRNVEKK